MCKAFFKILKVLKRHVCNRLQYLQYLQGILSTWPKMAKVQKDWGLLLLAHRSSFRGIGHWEVQHLLLPFGLGKSGCPDLFLRSLQLCSWKAHKLYQIILTLVRACSSKAQLIMVYWFMAPSCMAQASFCVLLGACQGAHTNSKAETSGWIRPFLGSLVTAPINSWSSAQERCHSFARDTFQPRNRGVEPQLPVGSVEAPGSNTKSGLEGYWGEPGHRITETNRK